MVKTMMKGLLFLAVFAFANVIQAKEVIHFATEAGYPPFEFRDEQNQFQGFDIELARAICQQLDAECHFTHQSFDSLIPSLKFKRADALIASIDVTKERQKQVDFSDIYYVNYSIFVSNKQSTLDLSNLAGKKIGVLNGTTHQKYLLKNYAQANIVPYDSFINVILDLKNGRLDGAFGDGAVVSYLIKKEPNLAIVGDKITDKDYFGTGLAIAVRKNNHKLLQRINGALAKIKQDGQYQAIYDKWFSAN